MWAVSLFISVPHPPSRPFYHFCLRLARSVYKHRTWPYFWWFPSQKYCIYLNIWFWPSLLLSLPPRKSSSRSHAHTHAHTNTLTHAHTLTHTCTHTHTHTRTHTHTHTKHTHTQTHTYTHVPAQAALQSCCWPVRTTFGWLIVVSGCRAKWKKWYPLHVMLHSRPSLQNIYKGFTKGVTGSHICWADRRCWIRQRKVNTRL